MPDRERVIMLTEAEAQLLLLKLQRLLRHDVAMTAIPAFPYEARKSEAESTKKLREKIEKQVVEAMRHDARIAKQNQMKRLAEANS